MRSTHLTDLSRPAAPAADAGRLEFECELPVPVDVAFAWHDRPGAFERLAPPWRRVDVVEATGGIRDGARVRLRLGAGPFSIPWTLEHRDWIAERGFVDVQLRGPFARWTHVHRFEPLAGRRSRLVDRIDVALPGERLTGPLLRPLLEHELRRLFTFRHRQTADDLALHARFADRPLRIAVSGASGLLGAALTACLSTGGHEVRRIVRRPARDTTEITWDPRANTVDRAALAGVDAVVHLAGEPIADGRWTAAKRRRIHDSRVDGTRAIAEAIAALGDRPPALVVASAVGWYGDRGPTPVAESAPAGCGFLAHVCRAWEAAADPARAAGARVVHARFGMILSAAGGALPKLLRPARLGLGAVVGDGRQMVSWVALDDAVAALVHALHDDALEGPMNVTAPGAVSAQELGDTLSSVLGRPGIGRVPAPVVRLALGRMADELLLAGVHARPAALLARGFRWRFPDLDGALPHTLGRATASDRAVVASSAGASA